MTRILKPGGWVVATAANPCPACGNGHWCTRTKDGEVVKCQRRESARPIKQKDGSVAWLHLAGDLAAPPVGKRQVVKAERDRLKPKELEILLKQHRTAVNPQRLEKFAAEMGVSVRALKAYGVGWDADLAAWSFPMFDGSLKPCGIRLRLTSPRPDGKNKMSVVGSRNGLFVPAGYDVPRIPAELSDDADPLLLLTPEGPTDCCAAFDLGFRAIGRPSASGGAPMLRELLAAGARQEVVVVADNDDAKYLPDGTPRWPGIEGAVALCHEILPVCGSLRFLLPPKGVKDVRQWVRDGCTSLVLAYRLKELYPVTEDWLRKAKARLMQKRLMERRAPAA